MFKFINRGSINRDSSKMLTEAVTMLMKEQLYLLNKAQKEKSVGKEHIYENEQLAQFLIQQNAYLL